MADIQPKDYSHLLGKVKLSDQQLLQHFTLYQGYVKKLNEIRQKLIVADPSGGNYSFNEFSELKRREAVAFNGTYLHELYFSNLAEAGTTEPDLELKQALQKAFGSYDAWVKNMKGCAISTPGWVVLTYDETDGSLRNHILYEHHIGLPVRQKILLALDCWEHAFMIDFGIKKADYVNVFFENVNWEAVNERFAVTV